MNDGVQFLRDKKKQNQKALKRRVREGPRDSSKVKCISIAQFINCEKTAFSYEAYGHSMAVIEQGNSQPYFFRHHCSEQCIWKFLSQLLQFARKQAAVSSL